MAVGQRSGSRTMPLRRRSRCAPSKPASTGAEAEGTLAKRGLRQMRVRARRAIPARVAVVGASRQQVVAWWQIAAAGHALYGVL